MRPRRCCVSAEGLFDDTGVFAPEHVVRNPACVDFILQGLGDRGITCEECIERIPSTAFAVC